MGFGKLRSCAVVVLTNAVYFNAAWKTPLDKGTHDRPFTRLDGRTVNVPMMTSTLEAHVQEPTYGQVQLDDCVHSMRLLPLPNRHSGLSESML